MPTFQSPRGTRDILPADQAVWKQVKQAAETIASQMGYQPITVPTYENLSLFERAIGSGTDVQDKELFLVRGKQSDRDDSQYALRPEGTAGIVRAFIQHGMQTWPQPVKLFSFVNNFRYDRPQKGRYREHVQFDIEYFGDSGPFADAWVIYTTWRFLQNVGLTGVELNINSLGTQEERAAYIQQLVAFCQTRREELSPDSQKRLATNPLRILDSKDAGDQKVRDAAPKLREALGEESQNHFAAVLHYLKAWQVPFTEDPYLVRGLDYYSHTAFEWVITDRQGQQDSLGGGGRYDGLLPQLDGPNIGAVGAGLGLDRICEELERLGKANQILSTPDLYLVAADEEGLAQLPILIDQLFTQIPGLHLECNLSKIGIGKELKRADKLGARFALVIGKREVEEGTYQLKELATSQTTSLASKQELIQFLQHGR